ncbi:MAG TPA: type II secretion system F family protein [Actinomycetota bacterium]|nr:type II secretion system F family protein [Actinomycetota bacterium]
MSLGVAGLLAAAAVHARHRDRMLNRLGAERARRAGRERAGSLSRLAASRGLRGGPSAYTALLAGTGAVAGAAGFHLVGPVGGMAALVGAPVAVDRWLLRRVLATRALAQEQLRDAVAALAAGARAGLSLRRALERAAVEAEPPLRGLLEGATRRLSLGQPLEESLARLAGGVGSPDARLLVAILHVHRRTGGDLPTLLDEVAEIVAGRAQARRQLRALTAQGRASGAVLALLPIAFVTLLSWTGGDGLGAYYRTLEGSLLLLGGLVCEGLGFLWIRRILRAGP